MRNTRATVDHGFSLTNVAMLAKSEMMIIYNLPALGPAGHAGRYGPR
jgi:hypothetical protein